MLFRSYIVAIDDLEFIEFTGEFSDLEELSKAELGAYAAKTWLGLRTLNDYVKAKLNGDANAGIQQFLTNPPSGYYVNWPAGKYAAKESESVERDVELRKERTFRVPKTVDPSGMLYMSSHLKIGVKLRAHFYDDVANTRKIYLGYIGNHLRTVSTN